MSGAEALATLLGLVGVGLMVRQHVWAWPVGIVQVTLSAWVFWASRLYSDVVLQGIFLGLQVYGWWAWTRGRPAAGAALPVTRLGGRACAALTGVGLLAMVTLSLLPVGLMQTWASVEHGYWYARSAEFLSGDVITRLRWMRVLGDTLFASGTVALVLFIVGLSQGYSYEPEPAPVANKKPAHQVA